VLLWNSGSTLRQDYVAMGSSINLAARLMGKAKGGIFIDEPTYTALKPPISQYLQHQDPIQVKGYEQPIPYYSFQVDHTLPPFSLLALPDDKITPIATTEQMKDVMQCLHKMMRCVESYLKRTDNSHHSHTNNRRTIVITAIPITVPTRHLVGAQNL
jgi:hypothetical protein